MSNRSGVLFFTILLGLISIYYLSFTFVSRSYKEKAEAFATDAEGKIDFAKKQRYLDSLWREKVYLGQTLQQVTERELGLGLDLQGGMHVVMEVSPADIVKGMAGNNSKSSAFQQALKNATAASVSSQSNYIDLFVKAYRDLVPDARLASLFSNSANRAQININSSDGEVITLLKKELDGSVDRAFKILQARIDKFGVANPNIQRLPGSNRILIELPGIDNPERVRRLLSGAAKLEFAEVYTLNEIGFGLDQLGSFLVREEEAGKAKAALTASAASQDTAASSAGTDLASQLAKSAADSSATDTSAVNKQNAALTNLFVPISNSALGVQLKDTVRANEILRNPEVKAMFPNDLVFMWDRKEMSGMPGQALLPLYFIKKPGGVAPLEGDVIVDAVGDFDQYGKPEVTMRMNGEGARKWRALTAANINRPIAIILDDLVYTAPNVTGEIPTGNSSISGNFTIDETKDMANVLKAGKLPAPTHIVEEAVVGSTLGSEAVTKGLISSLVGLIVVLAFMVVYYSKAGWIADIVLFINLFFLMGIMASLGAVLTLAGIAGIVLTIGMSVDANVLIYEGIKAELEEGKPFGQAVQDGFKGALSAIIDSNITTLLTGSILFVFGTGLVLGFATTLVIGLITSLFTAIFITKLLLDYQVKKGNRLAFASGLTKNWFKDTSFDFVSQRRKFYIVSGIVLVIGILSFIFKGFGLGVDFKGGRTYTIRFEQNVNTDDVRQVFTNALGQAPEVKTFDGFDQVKVTTDYLIEDTSVDADRKAQDLIAEAAASVPGNKGTIVSSSKVGPTIANDLIYSAFWAVLLAIIVNFVYIFIRFRNLAFGYAALISLAHDVLVLLVIFSLFNGWIPFISLDIDQAFIGSVLTIMGYSMNDTIVIFDRIRSYLNDPKARKESIPVIINNALNKTLSRTAVTGITTMMVLIVLMIFGGEVLRGFTFAMLIGVIVGTYSSLFIAAPIVVDALQRQHAKNPELTAAEVASKTKEVRKARS
ncbi:MAG: protein translocase subunit SecDF [Cytophagaceae bacterium SCN 52-12]|nr:MAG: protein translocase subunit SecDF [Cytophagaceae bacterium SCN 52-12]